MQLTSTQCIFHSSKAAFNKFVNNPIDNLVVISDCYLPVVPGSNWLRLCPAFVNSLLLVWITTVSRVSLNSCGPHFVSFVGFLSACRLISLHLVLVVAIALFRTLFILCALLWPFYLFICPGIELITSYLSR